MSFSLPGEQEKKSRSNQMIKFFNTVAIASITISTPSIHMNIEESKHRAVENQAQDLEPDSISKKIEKKSYYSKPSNVKTIVMNNHYEILQNVESKSAVGHIISNIPVSVRVEANNVIDILPTVKNEENNEKEEDVTMQKLVSHRDTVEKFGMALGGFMGFVTLIPPLFSLVSWGATVPASILFFSLSIVMLLRQKLRGATDGG